MGVKLLLDFAEKLRRARISKDLLQVELATKIGVNPSMVSSYENGTAFPKTERLIELCSILNVSSDYLLGISGNPKVDRDDLTDEQNLSLRVIAEQYVMLNNQLRKQQK